MSQAVTEPTWPPLDEATARAHAQKLRMIAAEHGITNLRFASPGRLLGHVAEDRDLADMAEFELGVADVLHVEVSLLSDGVLGNRNVSPDLLTATPL